MVKLSDHKLNRSLDLLKLAFESGIHFMVTDISKILPVVHQFLGMSFIDLTIVCAATDRFRTVFLSNSESKFAIHRYVVGLVVLGLSTSSQKWLTVCLIP